MSESATEPRPGSDRAAPQPRNPGGARPGGPRHAAATRWPRSDPLAWSRRLTLIVAAAGIMLVAAGAGLWVAFPAVTASPLPVVLGVVALVVAGCGRLGTLSTARYEDVPLAQPPPSTGPVRHPGRRRRPVRRQSTIAYLGMVLGSLFILPAVAYWHTEPLVGGLLQLAIAAGLIVGCFLAGPAAKFVVTPRHLHIDTAFHRIRVPRQLIGTFSRAGLGIRLDLRNGDHVDFRVDSPLWDTRGGEYRSNERCQVRTVQRIVTMLGEVPPADTTGLSEVPSGGTTGLSEVPPADATGTAKDVRLRRGMVAFAAVAALVTLPVFTIGVLAVFSH